MTSDARGSIPSADILHFRFFIPKCKYDCYDSKNWHVNAPAICKNARGKKVFSTCYSSKKMKLDFVRSEDIIPFEQ